ncbi:MAG: hypothetical protein L6R40_002288 [Gallowayella cf. fulva]|nr:MAG: hypothetical protein L6R40_002288 [Xanthomendoza cf. fulva]
MNPNNFPLGTFPAPPGLPALHTLVRADQIPKLASIPEEKKGTYINGVTTLWDLIKSKPPESPEYQNAYKKLHEVSESIKKTMSQGRAAGQNGPRPNGQGQQPQPNARPTGQQPGQPIPAQASERFSQKVMDNVRNQNFIIPPDIIVQGTQRAQTWLQEHKRRYALYLQQYETSQLKLQELKVIQQNKETKPLTPQEAQHLDNFKNQYETSNQQASQWLKKFLAQQGALRKQAGNPGASGTDTAARGQTQAVPSSEGATSVVDPQTSNTSPAVNTVSDHQGQPHTVSSALDAARNHPNAAGRPSSSAGTGGLGNQASVSQEGTTQGIDGQSAAEHSQSHQNMNPASSAPPQYHSSQAANPATSIPHGPHPLSHQAAVSQSAEKYSQHNYQSAPVQTSTHAHPPMSGRDPPNNNQKMPIPKELKHPPPQPVTMGPARPTLTGGPSNGAMGPLGQPAIQKQPSYVLEGEGERVLGRKKLEELVRQVTGGVDGEEGETLTAAAEETLLDVADDFVDQVVTAACKLAKLRSSQALELRDIQLVLERNYNIRIPGYASDELRTVKKVQPTPGWTQKVAAVQAAKVTGGKSDA